MEGFTEKFLEAAKKLLVSNHGFVVEGGFLLAPSTVTLIAELEEANRQRLIDKSLIDGDRELFIKLTNGGEKKCETH